MNPLTDAAYQPPIRLIKEVLKFFTDHPAVAESPEGVASWRLLQETLRKDVLDVTQAMEWLANQGYLIRIERQGAPQMFQLNAAHAKPAGPLAEHFANFLRIGLDGEEFLLEFGQSDEVDPQSEAHTRLVTDHQSLERFARVISETLQDFDQSPGHPRSRS